MSPLNVVKTPILALLLSLLACQIARAAEPDWQLIIRRLPARQVATNTAIAVPATQPAPATFSARISIQPGKNFDNEIHLDRTTIRISGIATESADNHFRLAIYLRLTQVQSDPAKSATPAETMPFGSPDAQNVTAITNEISLESFQTATLLKENEDCPAIESPDSRWLIRIERKLPQK